MTRILTGTYERQPAVAGMVDGLCLAATPVFAVMALVTADGGDMLCTMPGMSALSGMSVMYLLMGLFHAAPWLKRLARGTSHFTQTCKGE